MRTVHAYPYPRGCRSPAREKILASLIRLTTVGVE
jgi:hypothetical protein